MRELMLYLHFIGLGLAVGTGFSMMNLGIATKNLSPAEKGAFFLKAFSLSMNGNIGFALLILSGTALIFIDGPKATFEASGGFFHAKLVMVVVLAGLIGYMHSLMAKAKRENGGPVMLKIAKMGPFTLGTGLIIVLLAVLSFH